MFRYLLPLALLAFPVGAQTPLVVTRDFGPDVVGTVLGRTVTDPAGDELGLLVDILVDETGRPRAGIIDVGGFLGVGTRRVAIGWSMLHFHHAEGETTISEDIPPDLLAAAPQYRVDDGHTVIVGRQPAAAQPARP